MSYVVWLSCCYNQEAVCLLRGTDWAFDVSGKMYIMIIQSKFSFDNYSYQKDERVKPGQLLGK